jgi:hypothetical protein
MQEALAAHIQVECAQDRCWTPPSLVQILRGIRLGSLMHGTPEAIPVWCGNLLFPKCSAAHDPSRASVVWTCDDMFTDDPMYALTRTMWGLRSQTFEMPVTRTFLLEAPQLALVQTDVATRLTEEVDYAVTLMEIQLIVRAAIRHGEPVLIRKWMREPNLELPLTGVYINSPIS